MFVSVAVSVSSRDLIGLEVNASCIISLQNIVQQSGTLYGHGLLIPVVLYWAYHILQRFQMNDSHSKVELLKPKGGAQRRGCQRLTFWNILPLGEGQGWAPGLARRNVRILWRRMTKACRETFVTYSWNLSDKSQKAIFTVCWRHWITILCIDSQLSELSIMVTDCVTDLPRWFCDSLWKIGDYWR